MGRAGLDVDVQLSGTVTVHMARLRMPMSMLRILCWRAWMGRVSLRAKRFCWRSAWRFESRMAFLPLLLLPMALATVWSCATVHWWSHFISELRTLGGRLGYQDLIECIHLVIARAIMSQMNKESV